MKNAVSLVLLASLTLVIYGATQSSALAQEPEKEFSDLTAKDVEFDFHFLKFGFTRKKVIGMLGTPKASAEWHTLAIKYHRLEWVASSGERFVALFFNDRLFRWKKCSALSALC